MIRYVTRWALTTGIRTVEGEFKGGYFYNKTLTVHVPSREAFETLEEAKTAARAFAKKRAASLRAQAARLADPKWEPKVRDAD